MIWRSVGLIAASLALATVAGATALEVRLETAGGGVELLSRKIQLAVGEEARVVRSSVSLAGERAPVEVELIVTLEEARGERLTLVANGIIRPRSATSRESAVAWTSRTFELGHGEEVSFVSEPGGRVRFVVGYGGGGLAPIGPLVEMRATLRVEERTLEGPARLVTSQRLRLVGPEATEIILEGRDASGPPAMILRLTPLSRDDDGVTLSLGIEVPARSGGAPQTVRQDDFVLGWDDSVSIAGLRGPRGELLVEIDPER